jgi:hypothetical protein
MYALALVPMSGTAGTSWTRGDTARTSPANSASDASPAMGASAGYSSRSHGGGMSPRLLAGSPGAQSRFTSGPPPPASPGNHRLVLGHPAHHRVSDPPKSGSGCRRRLLVCGNRFHNRQVVELQLIRSSRSGPIRVQRHDSILDGRIQLVV